MRPSPLVRCDGCEFAWYGASAADGLHILGACPRCGGPLVFLDHTGSSAVPAVPERLRTVAPAAVMGTPTSWAR